MTALDLARSLVASPYREGAVAHELASALVAMEEERQRRAVLESLLADISDVTSDAPFGSVKVRRDDVPALFTDGDGAAMYLPDAIRRALALANGAQP